MKLCLLLEKLSSDVIWSELAHLIGLVEPPVLREVLEVLLLRCSCTQLANVRSGH